MVESKFMRQNKEIDIKNVENFIKENLAKADDSGAACPDGRYTVD